MGIIQPATLRQEGVVSDEALTIEVSVPPVLQQQSCSRGPKERPTERVTKLINTQALVESFCWSGGCTWSVETRLRTAVNIASQGVGGQI
jgi:hypothetical protein